MTLTSNVPGPLSKVNRSIAAQEHMGFLGFDMLENPLSQCPHLETDACNVEKKILFAAISIIDLAHAIFFARAISG